MNNASDENRYKLLSNLFHYYEDNIEQKRWASSAYNQNDGSTELIACKCTGNRLRNKMIRGDKNGQYF